MKFRKRFTSLVPKTSSESKAQHHKKRGVFHRRRKLLFFAKAIALLLLLLSASMAYAQAPTIQKAVSRAIQTAIAPLKPKPRQLIQSDQVLSPEIQAAIETLAQQQLKQEQANATLPFTTPSQITNEGLLEPIFESIEEVLTRDPANRAKLRIKKINRFIAKLQNLLANDKSIKAIDQAVTLIRDIGSETDKIVADPKVQTDREILTLQIEQYNRLQLIIQQLEDTLAFNDYLRIEDARQLYLVSTAVKAINSAPSLEAIHNIALPVVANFVGDDFAELKALEIIADFEDEIESGAKQKLVGLQKELATSFEKKMLKLPRDVRNRKLQSYIHYSFGDPMLQIRSFERMQDALSDREIIMGVDSLKEVAIQRLTDRIFELENQADLNRYVDRLMQHPQEIKVLGEMKIAITGGPNQERIQRFDRMVESVVGKITGFLNTATPEQLQLFLRPSQDGQIDLMDVVTIVNLEARVAAAPGASSSIKQQFSQAKKDTLSRFSQEISTRDFLTQSRLSYNPVSSHADVRLLLTNPQSLVILQNLRMPTSVIQAATNIIQEHLIFQINDPDIFADYEEFITQNNQVNQTLQRYMGRRFAASLSKKSRVVQKVALAQKQQLYEIVQQITQSIFASRGTTDFEKQLPDTIRQQIQTLKRNVPVGNIPRLTVPGGVTLPAIAALTHSVQHAIVQLARARIRDGQKSSDVKLDLTLTASDLDIAQPRILPDNPLYPVKHLIRRAQLLLTFDPLSRAELLIKHNNERTLEGALLLEKSASRKSVDLVLETLLNIEKDFNRLKASAEKLDTVKQRQPERADGLIDSMIKNGLARQTVFALIEDKVYGADYVKVEKIRQSVLRDGIDALLQLSHGNAQALVGKLEKAVRAGSGSQFKELKAIELLTEIKRFQPEKIGEVLEASEIRLVQQFEAKLLSLNKEERERDLIAYASGLPGNPVRQFEAYEELRDSFKSKETLSLVYSLEDKAVDNLTDIVSSITDENTLREFAQKVVGTESQDLKIIAEVELHVDTPDALDVESTPIEQKIEEIKTIVEQEIVEEFIENPESLTESDLFSDPSNEGSTNVTDVKVVQELVEIIEQSPVATPEIVETIQELEEKVVNDFIETVTTNPAQTLEPAPEVIETLVELKEETSPDVDLKIDAAIVAEVQIIEEQLASEVSSAETLETYLSQIEESPVVAQVISQVGGSGFTQVLEETKTELEQTTTQEQTLLQETIKQVQEEIFAAPVYDPSPVEQTLSESIQAEIVEVKAEVPSNQILQTTVTAETTVTVESVQTSTETQTEVTTPSTEISTTIIVEQTAPTTESSPAPVPETQTTTETPTIPGL